MDTRKGKMMKSVLLIFTILFIGGMPVAAEEVGGKQTMDDMVVTGTRTQERAIDVPVTTEVITREKIEMSGATHGRPDRQIYHRTLP